MSASAKRYPMPFVRIELALLGIEEGGLVVLLAKRAEEPFAGLWALPGGVLRIDLDEDLAAAANRIAGERLNTQVRSLQQLGAVGSASRDPRAPWGLSVVYRAAMRTSDLSAQPGKRVDSLAWHPVDRLPAARHFAFDHLELVRTAVDELRTRVQGMAIPQGLLPEEFTLGELQAACEAVLSRPLDKSSFRRKLADAGQVEAIEGAMRGGANRPAQLYRMKNA